MMYELLNASFQRIRRTFVFAYAIAAGAEVDIKNNKKYFLPGSKINNYNVLIDGRNFYAQPINDFIKQYDEVRKVSAGQGDDYATGCLLDYAYFKDNYKLIAVDLSKQKALDADPRAIQQLVFQGVVGRNDVTKIRLNTNYTLFFNNQKKLCQNFTKEQQNFVNQCEWLNTLQKCKIKRYTTE